MIRSKQLSVGTIVLALLVGLALLAVPACKNEAQGPDANSDPIAVSLPFDLPGSAGVVVRTEVSLGKPVALPPRLTGSGSMAPTTGGQRDFTALQVSLTVFLILLLVASLLFKGSRRRIE